MTEGTVVRKCSMCQAPFTAWRAEANRRRSEFCSNACFMKASEVILCCTHCGDQFRRTKAQRLPQQPFCSRECLYAYRSARKQIEVIQCGHCRSEFEARRCDGQKYCSNHCAGKARIGTKMSPEARAKKLKWWPSLSPERQREHARKATCTNTPTAPEARLIDICDRASIPLRFVGDGALWITTGTTQANPDFVRADGLHQCVEVFGNHWHKPEEEEGRKEQLSGAGWECLVLWELDMRKMTDAAIATHVASFLGMAEAAVGNPFAA